MTILQKQPVFDLKIEGLGAMYFIELNGVRVLKQYNAEGKISTRIPVNHYMRSGSNTLKILTWSGDEYPINEHAYVNLELIVSESSQPNVEYPISTIVFDNTQTTEEKSSNSSLSGKYNSLNGFSASSSGDVTVEDIMYKQVKNVYTYSRTIDIPSSLPLWAFFSSDNLPNYNGMEDNEYYQNVDNLLVEYMKVQEAIKNNTTDQIISMFEERNKELDAAFYYPPGTYENKIKVALKDAANDDTAELVSLKPNDIFFDLSNNNKLNRLARKGKGPAIALNFKDIEGSYSFDMIFRMQDGKWILTR
ncbi:hypothetical protein [Colwellia echini]|uniref:DUF4878 domain-containing protein n=1 Tax=Colwellia echini TaxID=1982103 RepID=A0ABY3MWE5_9GAMM|nr:hypothetical protein [Colwellia echini]TYK65424.1 hypothetical protein CWS31_010025 [Colwellia echini]